LIVHRVVICTENINFSIPLAFAVSPDSREDDIFRAKLIAVFLGHRAARPGRFGDMFSWNHAGARQGARAHPSSRHGWHCASGQRSRNTAFLIEDPIGEISSCCIIVSTVPAREPAAHISAVDLSGNKPDCQLRFIAENPAGQQTTAHFAQICLDSAKIKPRQRSSQRRRLQGVFARQTDTT